MKTLELNQMEQVEGGQDGWACAGAASSGASIVVATATIATATGPIGWGLFALGAAVVGLVSVLATSEGDPCESHNAF